MSSRKKPREPRLPRPPKKRARPAFDSAVVTCRQLFDAAKVGAWSHMRLRRRLRENRHASKKVWREAIKHVFGVPSRELPDLRQLSLFGDE